MTTSLLTLIASSMRQATKQSNQTETETETGVEVTVVNEALHKAITKLQDQTDSQEYLTALKDNQIAKARAREAGMLELNQDQQYRANKRYNKLESARDNLAVKLAMVREQEEFKLLSRVIGAQVKSEAEALASESDTESNTESKGNGNGAHKGNVSTEAHANN